MRLLICDDDISTVDVIESQLDGEALGITGFLRAYNGEVAKEIISREKPELILCDIGMPKCNGIQVLKFVYENKIETEFAFLTCYEDFEYAQAALRYGASNYVTKPFQMEELTLALQQMIARVKQRRYSLQAQQDSVLSSVLRQISDGLYGTDRATIRSLLQRNGLRLNAGDMWHMVVSCVDLTDDLREAWSQELLMYTLARLHDEVLVGYIGSAYTIPQADERFLWCTCFVPEGRCGGEELRERCQKLLDLCVGSTGANPVILMSDPFPLYGASTVKASMHSRMRKVRLYAGRLLHYREAEDLQRGFASFLDAPLIHRYLKNHDRDGFQEYIYTVTEGLAASRNYTRQAMDSLHRELRYVFSTCLRDNGIPENTIYTREEVQLHGAQAAQSAAHMRRFADVLFRAAEEELRRLAEAEDIIARLEDYIKVHFRENINLEDVAAVACITPNYLSKQFRARKGMNLREYINQIRIQEAKRLLLTTKLSVSEVAGLAGYENISYFSTVFRKITGMSPVDWRSIETGEDSYEI